MKGLFVKKVHVLNKGIVHMIDYILWNGSPYAVDMGLMLTWSLRIIVQ